MKSIISALVVGLILFGSHYVFAGLFYTDRDIIDLEESEVKEIE